MSVTLKDLSDCTVEDFRHLTNVLVPDGDRSLRYRRNGSTILWKRSPLRFRIPLKFGLYGYDNLSDTNIERWTSAGCKAELSDLEQPIRFA